MADLVSIERDGPVAVMRLARPPVNALNLELIADLEGALADLAADDGVRALVCHGGEKAFCAGADIEELFEGPHQEVRKRVARLQRVVDSVEGLPFPTIAAITRYALGGGLELALGFDFRFAAAGSRLGQPEIALGIIPGGGGTQRLPRLIGPARAKWVIYSGDPVDAEQAETWGLVDEVVEQDVLERAVEAAKRFADGPTLALAAAKRAIDRGLQGSLATGLELELDAFVGLFSTDDAAEGIRSFKEHGPGKATFHGR